MTADQKTHYLTQLRKVLDELAVQFPFFVTPAYIEQRLNEETAQLKAK